MPKFRVGVYRYQYFHHGIEAKDPDEAAMLMLDTDSDMTNELMHDWPEKISHDEWQLNYVESEDQSIVHRV
jgi:hypothetical protein